MVHKYADNQANDGGFEAAVLANANRGGENVATGALIGALMGAACGFERLPKSLVEGLYHRAEIEQEIEQFAKAVPFAKL